jgi:hypothetical protein
VNLLSRKIAPLGTVSRWEFDGLELDGEGNWLHPGLDCRSAAQ